MSTALGPGASSVPTVIMCCWPHSEISTLKYWVKASALPLSETKVKEQDATKASDKNTNKILQQRSNEIKYNERGVCHFDRAHFSVKLIKFLWAGVQEISRLREAAVGASWQTGSAVRGKREARQIHLRGLTLGEPNSKFISDNFALLVIFVWGLCLYNIWNLFGRFPAF